MEVHVVSKTNNQEHAVARPSDSAYEKLGRSLPVSHVRVKPLVISLSSNNLSYARGGEVLYWWDTYPVPVEVSELYNDRESWGIVPARGFGVVTEAAPDIAGDIPLGTVLWGSGPLLIY
ncbi:hypothetical protein BDW74DRAFT_174337 [Aspergillus multicolor]|uniref:uncharacterized protein n=1 Tax=Aspergillus multicolor TaxID=41759 RepID=UPI003CCE2739